ncbi:MAG: hypothetical protein KGJ38_02595 [Burkholderiaceae bacterium]|nr:hypothetical protein [Burkholderiaceae bacterium]
MIALLVVVLPLRGYAMPAVPCCAEVTGDPAAQTAQLNVAPAVAVYGCESDSRAKGSLSGMSHPSCTAACAAVVIVATAVNDGGRTVVGVLSTHLESDFTSWVPKRLERPPQLHRV